MSATTVLALHELPRKPGRYELELDNARRLTTGIDLIAELKLKPGRQLSARELQQLESGAQFLACYDKALATLGARSRSTADLRRYLKTKDFTDAQIAPAIEKLLALGLLNDLEYARTFARSRSAPSRGLGPRRIAAELARKGIPRATAEQVLREIEEDREANNEEAAVQGQAPTSAIEEAAAKKLKSLQKEPPEVRQRRLFAYLARRGFSTQEILRVLDRGRMTNDGC